MLTDLDIEPFYRTNTHDLLRDFYLPCLNHSTRYDRAVGYFTSHTLALAARGVGRLAERGGRMRSPELSL